MELSFKILNSNFENVE